MTHLDDAAVNALKPIGRQDKSVQGDKFIPIVADMSVAGITIGRALLLAINASAPLALQLGFAAVPISAEEEKSFLRSITYIALTPSGATDILAYAAAGTHKTPLTVGALNYKPSVEVWRNYITGVAGTVVEVGIGN